MSEFRFLVLGKIQSGKTSHLLSSVAWAADSNVSFVSIFTGTNNALNTQTIKRLRNDITNSIDGSFIKIFEIPTSHKGKNFENLLLEIRNLLKFRIDPNNKNGSRVMPVFVSMKNPTRIRTLTKLVEVLSDDFRGN
jgi:hypothetical protein